MIFYRDGKWVAFNTLTRERMEKPVYPRLSEYDGDLSAWYKATYRHVSALKIWDAFVEACPRETTWQRPKLVHATEKGIPVPHTGRSRWHSAKNSGKTGVIGSSRMLPHRYMDEGDKGKGHNRHIKRLERALWQREWIDEGYDVEDAVTVAQWFYDMSDDTDSDLIPSVYTVGETVVDWPSDYYGEYDYADMYDYDPGPYDVADYLDFDPYAEDWCAHCGGPCEL